MATISIQIPDAAVQRVTDAICDGYGYQATIPDPNDETKTIPNPVTRAQYVKVWLRGRLKDAVVVYEANQAASLARATAQAKAESDIG